MKATIQITKPTADARKQEEVDMTFWFNDDLADDIYAEIGGEQYWIKRDDLLRLLRSVPPKRLSSDVMTFHGPIHGGGDGSRTGRF